MYTHIPMKLFTHRSLQVSSVEFMCCEEPRPAWSGRNSTTSRTTGITSAAHALQKVFTLCSVTQRHNRETAKIQDSTRKLGHWPLKGGILLLPATSPNADRLTYFITRFSSKFARSYNKRANHTSNMLLDCYIKYLILFLSRRLNSC